MIAMILCGSEALLHWWAVAAACAGQQQTRDVWLASVTLTLIDVLLSQY